MAETGIKLNEKNVNLLCVFGPNIYIIIVTWTAKTRLTEEMTFDRVKCVLVKLTLTHNSEIA